MRVLASPAGFPFCPQSQSSFRRTGSSTTNLPLGELQVKVAAALGLDAGFILEGLADNAGGDCEVLVVAVEKGSANLGV